MEEHPVTLEDQIKDLYDRTEQLLVAVEKISEILALHTETLKGLCKATNSLLPVKSRQIADML